MRGRRIRRVTESPRFLPWGGAVLLLIIIGIALSGRNRRENRQVGPAPAGGTGTRTAPAQPEPIRNPLIEQLRPRPGRAVRKGVAVAVLVDVSGSMKEQVKSSEGPLTSKINIARRATLDLIRKADDFAQEHKEKEILLGLYEFSGLKGRPSCRRVVPLSRPNVGQAHGKVTRMSPGGGTPIGDAIIMAKRDLDATRYDNLHILVITDGENTQGYDPADVADALFRLEWEDRAQLYFIAFDIAAETFDPVRDAGGLVLPAANEQELGRTLDYILTGKILAEQPEVPGGK